MRIAMHQKPLDIRLTRSAETALVARSETLLAEMELIFGCMIRKQVIFHELVAIGEGDAIPASTRLAVRFVALMSRAACTLTDNSQEKGGLIKPTHEPLDNPGPYVPRWLVIDYRKGQWHGEFGYDAQGTS